MSIETQAHEAESAAGKSAGKSAGMAATTPAAGQGGAWRLQTILFMLLAMMTVGVFGLWNASKAKDQRIADLTAAKNSEIEALEKQIQTDSSSMAELKQNYENQKQELETVKTVQIPSLKNSFAKAEKQRANHLQLVNHKLVDANTNLRSENDSLFAQVEQLGELKRSLSFARAKNQRAVHVLSANANLIDANAGLRSDNEALSAKGAELDSLKQSLSFARAQNQRTESVIQARANLMEQNAGLRAQIAQTTVGEGQDASQSELQADVETLKEELSAARAANQRAVHTSAARDKLLVQLNHSIATRKLLARRVVEGRAVKKALSYANAKNARLEHVSRARDRLMTEINQLKLERYAQ